MFDIVNGKVRARKWPRSRGKPKTLAQKKRQDDFAAAQRASKFTAPQQMVDFTNATDGTPLLPRDLMTMMLYNRMYAFQLPNGKVLNPMPAVNDVSASLDVLGAEVGQILVRQPQGWRQAPAPGGTTITVLHDETITAPVPYVQINGLGNHPFVRFYALQLQASTGGIRRAIVSLDNAVTWKNTNGDYDYWSTNGWYAPMADFPLHQNGISDPRGSLFEFWLNTEGLPPVLNNCIWPQMVMMPNDVGPITNMRIFNDAGNLISGRVIAVSFG